MPLKIVVHDYRDAPSFRPAPGDAVDVWTISLDAHNPSESTWNGVRAILGRYLDLSPASVTIATAPLGKPMLDVAVHGAALRFNVSHSHALALLAVAWHRDVGVDLEYVRAVSDLDGIVTRFFAPAERAALVRLEPERRRQAFFQYWTFKEAYLKACGDGIGTRALDLIEIDWQDDEPQARVRALDRPDMPPWCEMFRLLPRAGYAAAVAVV